MDLCTKALGALASAGERNGRLAGSDAPTIALIVAANVVGEPVTHCRPGARSSLWGLSCVLQGERLNFDTAFPKLDPPHSPVFTLDPRALPGVHSGAPNSAGHSDSMCNSA